jgi:acetyltransferase
MSPAQRAFLTTTWPLMPGHAIAVRPLLPTDANLIIELGKSLSSESLYQRFLNGGVKQNPRLLDRLVKVDFSRDLALIATVALAGTEAPIGVARYARFAAGSDAADFAITLADAWHGRGIGKRLLGRLVDCAAERGITRLTGDVLATNEAMLALARSVGFKVTFHPDGGHLRQVSLLLSERLPAPLDAHEETDL